MIGLNPFSLNERKKKSVGPPSKNTPSDFPSTMINIPLQQQNPFSIQNFIIPNELKFINDFVINPASNKTRAEEIAIQRIIGGRLPSDNAPSYKAAVKTLIWIINHCKGLTIKKLDDKTAWLIGGKQKVKIRYKECLNGY